MSYSFSNNNARVRMIVCTGKTNTDDCPDLCLDEKT